MIEYFKNIDKIDPFKEKQSYITNSKSDTNFYWKFSILEYEEIPIVFIAEDEMGDLYLCDCVEFRNHHKILVAKTSIPILKDLVNQKICLYEALISVARNIIVATREYDSDVFEYKYTKIEDLKENELPEKGAMILFPDEDSLTNIYKLEEDRTNKIYQIKKYEIYSISVQDIIQTYKFNEAIIFNLEKEIINDVYQNVKECYDIDHQIIKLINKMWMSTCEQINSYKCDSAEISDDQFQKICMVA